MSSIHVHPVGDLTVHDTENGEGCVCGPTQRPVKHEDGSVGWVIVHHSLDGRELREEV